MNEMLKILNLLSSQKNSCNHQNIHNQNQNNKNSYYPSDIVNENNKNNRQNNSLDIQSLLKILSSNDTSDIFKNLSLPNGLGNIFSMLTNNKKTAVTTVSKKSKTNFENFTSIEDYYS